MTWVLGWNFSKEIALEIAQKYNFTGSDENSIIQRACRFTARRTHVQILGCWVDGEEDIVLAIFVDRNAKGAKPPPRWINAPSLQILRATHRVVYFLNRIVPPKWYLYSDVISQPPDSELSIVLDIPDIRLISVRKRMSRRNWMTMTMAIL